jgi:molybdate transport system ATP-binding protein
VKRISTVDGDIDLKINFEVGHGELVTLFGKSGTGKTTILRLIAGLATPDQGIVEVNGETWFDYTKNINLPARKRQLGFVFQEYTVFPHMTVEENLAYALLDQNDRKKLEEFLEITQLKTLRHLEARQLSGGQKQRVALMRALLREPKILLLDEPFSSLDYEMRARLQDELKNICARYKLSTIFVSHDLSDIFKLSQRILFLEQGAIKLVRSPEELFAIGLPRIK